MPSDNKEYDVFISHAVSDQIDIVTPLVDKLEEAGIKVWCSSTRLIAGKKLDETIREGLIKSKHGILVITLNYLGREWPQREFHALWAKEKARIFTVWHNIDEKDIEKYDGQLAKYTALNTKKGLEYVVDRLVREIKKEQKVQSKPVSKSTSTEVYTGTFTFLLLSAVAIWFFLIRDLPSDAQINTSIKDRIRTFQTEIMTDHQVELQNSEGDGASLETISNFYDRYNRIKAHYRNEYFFGTGYAKFNFKKNVEPAVDKNLDLLTPENAYGFEQPDIYLINHKPSPHTLDVKYIFINTQPADYQIVDENKVDDYTYLVEVIYQNYIRYLSVALTYSKRSDWMKRKETVLLGFMPTETYKFKKEEDKWVFAGLED
ncbi:toll/interleukin-1 receptor domain-containing protein [Fulvivirga sp. 29W222]|uniref:Toll/interleukin-1 receptor domain-containing protein n=1 Tax=Fulvivirga marina TaxID=2494733 RepID=A0A937FX17_9BACT|nr:toll/interleukin-1 receptor domain-containing protein [Fulvivirga marina]MBL6446093.1 toll/interleukin-1 receptor domain-containing protein [Fulvivirga marina]